MTPRDFFPLMPDEVFDMWLAPFIEKIGWPFTEENTDSAGTRWRYLLGRIEINDWRKFVWQKVNINIAAASIDEYSRAGINNIIVNCTTTASTITNSVENTQERFEACVDYINQYGSIPKAIIALQTGDGIEILDGSHRLAALFYIGIANPFWIPAWMPSPRKD